MPAQFVRNDQRIRVARLMRPARGSEFHKRCCGSGGQEIRDLLQLAHTDQVIRNLERPSLRIRHRMQATRDARLRLRGGDVIEPILADRNRRTAVGRSKHQVYVSLRQVVIGARRFRAVPEEKVESSRRNGAGHRVRAEPGGGSGIV